MQRTEKIQNVGTLERWLRVIGGAVLVFIGLAYRLAGSRAACARAFASGKIGVGRTLFSKADMNGLCSLPLTREDLYHEAVHPATSGGTR